MTYAIHDIFHTVQGEGANMGRPAVFLRFSGCNLWSGREQDRAGAVCTFCDTDFAMTARVARAELVARVRALAPSGLLVFTGGEPALQLDQALVDEFHALGFETAIETNGTRPIPAVHWVCVSPKAGADLVLTEADELKLVYPQGEALTPEAALGQVSARHYWLSPMDGPDWGANVAAAVAYVKRDPRWRLNIQAHKFWGIE